MVVTKYVKSYMPSCERQTVEKVTTQGVVGDGECHICWQSFVSFRWLIVVYQASPAALSPTHRANGRSTTHTEGIPEEAEVGGIHRIVRVEVGAIIVRGLS